MRIPTSPLFILFPLISSFPTPSSKRVPSHLLSSVTNVSNDDTNYVTTEQNSKGAISLNVEELSVKMGGWGRARLAWDYYRVGIDPLQHFTKGFHNDVTTDGTPPSTPPTTTTTTSSNSLSRFMNIIDEENTDISVLLPSSRATQTLGRAALEVLAESYKDYGGKFEGGVVTLSQINSSSDETTKLLIKLHDGFEVETVIIPWKEKGFSTLCISSQVGCKQACTFCATGRMGELRNLAVEEILGQFFMALKICRLGNIPSISNVVFMGMGEPAANSKEVKKALEILTDVDLFHQAQTKVTVSTVAPTPDAFIDFKDSPCVLAWSVHAANDELRKKLVPTTKYKMHELRQALIDVLLGRPKKLRVTMLEVALIDGINDSLECAEELAIFTQVIIESVPNIKLMVNLIPFNDIGHQSYRKPNMETVKSFQKVLRDHNINSHVRVTRGDDESAACGMLTTKRSKNIIKS